MCPHCNYNPQWQERGLEEPPPDDCGAIFEGPRLTRGYGLKEETRTVYGCPSCKGVWMDY